MIICLGHYIPLPPLFLALPNTRDDAHYSLLRQYHHHHVISQIKEGGVFQNQYGYFKHEDFVGKKFGEKVLEIQWLFVAGKFNSFMLADLCN